MNEQMTEMSGQPDAMAMFDIIECPDSTCPVCDVRGLTEFFSIPGIPAHSCSLQSSREGALNVPTGDMRLCLCRSCGFITNSAFRPVDEVYGDQYEETQGFSPTFSRYLMDLALRLITEHDLRDRSILEIGCGKGQFVVAMCELGMKSGIGIDPSFVEGRMVHPAAARVRFIRDFYGPAYMNLDGDFICCRHTLEHIVDPATMIRTIADAIRGRGLRLVFLDVPDTKRVLDEGAFWDVYHEHCSYFTASSLATLFTRCGLVPKSIRREFDDQYLIITATNGGIHGLRDEELEKERASMREMIDRFRSRALALIEHWKLFIKTEASRGRTVVVWGSGSKAVAFLSTLGVRRGIDYVVDINPHRHGKYMAGTGQIIVSPDDLRSIKPDVAIVMNPIYCDEIQRDLDAMQLKTELLPVTG